MLSTEFDCPSAAPPAGRREESFKAGNWGGLALVRARSGTRPSGNASHSLRVAISGRSARRCACKESISRRAAEGLLSAAAAPAHP